MKTPPASFSLVAISVASLLAFAAPPRALCQTGSRANAQALVEEAKKGEYERKMAAKQTVADRLGEDLKKAKQETAELEKGIAKVSSATSESTGELAKLGAEKKRLTRDLELANLWIDAEKLKAEGLKLLENAHAKSRDALTKRVEEIDQRTALVAAEMAALAGKSSAEPASSGPKASRPKQGPTLTEMRRHLAKAEQATINASANARQAMEAAAEKVRQADAAAAKAGKKRAEFAQETNPAAPAGNEPVHPSKRK